MKKIIALALSVCMLFSLTCVSAFATPAGEKHAETIQEVKQARAGNLLTIEPTLLSGSESYTVTPAKGEKLMIGVSVISGSYPLNIKVYKNGGWWASENVDVPVDKNTYIYPLIDNCNGEPYTIVFSSKVECTFTAIVYSA